MVCRTGSGQNEPRMAVVNRACTPEQSKDNQKTRFVEEGQGRLVESLVQTGDMLPRQKPPQNQTKRGVRKNPNGTAKREQRANTDMPKKTKQYNT